MSVLLVEMSDTVVDRRFDFAPRCLQLFEDVNMLRRILAILKCQCEWSMARKSTKSFYARQCLEEVTKIAFHKTL